MLGPRLDSQFCATRSASLAEGWWSRTVTGSGTVVPDGAVDLIWTPHRCPWVAGPDTVPRSVDLAPGTPVLGLRLRPGVARGVLRDGVDQAVNQLVPLSAVWPRSLVDELEESLDLAGSMGEAATRLAAALVAWIPDTWAPDIAVVDAMVRLRADLPLETKALSERQFRRRFVHEVGYGPTFYRRVVRLDRFSDLLAQDPDRTMAELASWAGYFDESHLSRDCLALAGSTPGELRAAL